MSDKKSVYKPRPVSGFPEWLPEVRLVEQQWFDHIRRVFESYGFCSIETPSVEELDVLTAKGEVDKEIYVIERLHKEEGAKEARLALHFDQTVPLARYVAQNFNDLVFPFKRYQMQRVWRGERPQAGRFREFYQCDIDVINVDALPLHFDAELPAVMWEVMTGLPGMEGEKIQMQISNRKILIGLLEALGVTDITGVTRIIDKIEKIGEVQVRTLMGELGLNADQCHKALTLAQIKTSSAAELKQKTAALGITAETFAAGVEELAFVLDNLSHLPAGAIVADLSIVRGLDYYTGIVYETRFVDDPTYGSICSGGRYDDLASQYINKKLPGVGISIGFSRLFDRMRLADKLPVARKSPADVMVVLRDEDRSSEPGERAIEDAKRRAAAAEVAQTLRKRGLKVEMYHAVRKLSDQIKYAERKGIPFIWLPPVQYDGQHEVKDMNARTQGPADPQNWVPTRRQSMRLHKFFVCLAVLALSIPVCPAFAADEVKDKDAKVEAPKEAATEASKKGEPEWLAKGSVYSPEGCEFEVTFPEQPYQTKRCDPVEKDKNCSNMTSFTRVYGIDSSITYNVSCTPTSEDMYDKYDDNVMRTTLSGMTRSLNLEQSQTGFMPLKEAKMAVLLGSGKTENKQDDLIYTAQLWIGHKSVFTLEGELRGKYQADSDLLFAEILKTAKLKGTATPVDVNGNVIPPKGKTSESPSKPTGAMAFEAAKLEKSKNAPDKK